MKSNLATGNSTRYRLCCAVAVAISVFALSATAKGPSNPPLSGAIYTTMIVTHGCNGPFCEQYEVTDGALPPDTAIVDGNTQYLGLNYVFLYGGPTYTPAGCGRTGMPDGLYYFEVTNPSTDQLVNQDPFSVGSTGDRPYSGIPGSNAPPDRLFAILGVVIVSSATFG